jgi:hypothetical protein
LQKIWLDEPMVEVKPQSKWIVKLDEVLGFDLRSLAVFRIGLALVVMAELIMRSQALTAHYTDYGVLPRTVLIGKLLNPWYWSINLISGQPFVQGLLFIFAFLVSIALLVGYRTRIASLIIWVMIISIQNRNPNLIFAADDVLRAILFWAMFLPLGACYSVDSSLNSSSKPLPKRVASGATFAFMVQLCFIYIWSALFKTTSPDWWETGNAVYYALSFEQYSTGFAHFLVGFPLPFLIFITHVTLIFEWVGPLMIFIPFKNSFFRCVAIISFILLHIGFGLSFHLGILSYLCVFVWLAFVPSGVWDKLQKRVETPERLGLVINYDRDCGFCKKVVYLIRTFIVLGKPTLREAQENESIYADMMAYNSWVVEDWQGNRHYKFAAIAYIIGLSPLFFFLEPVLRWTPIMAIGNRFYETVANNRKTAGIFTKPLQFRPLEIQSSLLLNIISILLITLAFIWNLTNFTKQTVERREPKQDWIQSTRDFLQRKTFHKIAIIGYLTRLDQSWSIFAPGPPRDDGWYVIKGTLKDGTEIDLITEKSPINWNKPNIKARYKYYPNQQWRVYFINLNRAIGRQLYPEFGNYLCQQWNAKHQQDQHLKHLEIYLMDERTVNPDEQQTVTKRLLWQQSCGN